jgi:histidyl-tRNA synthetase
MIRLKDTRHSNTADFLNSAIRIAEYYGFSPLDDMKPQRARARSEGEKKRPSKGDSEIAYARRDERALSSVARKCVACTQGREEGAPALLAWRVSSNNASIPAVSFELHILGATSAVAEALLLVVASAVAEEAGIGERFLSINSIGSMESSNRYVRDVGTYLRKHIETISPTLRPRAAIDPLGTLVQLVERGHPAAPRAPQSLEYLTEDERRKFWELLEYLEAAGLPYELSPHVLGSRDCWAHSLYEMSTTADEESGARLTFASGGRYDPLASRFAGTHTSAATITINCEVRGKTTHKREVRGLPSIYYAHLGPEARRKTLVVLEDLRRAEIPVYQSVLFDKIGDQMRQARQLATPYVLIMGYKEAMEGTILVREVSTNSQEAIPVPELTGYLKRRRFAPSRMGA